MSLLRKISCYLSQVVPLFVDDIMNILVFFEAKWEGADRHPMNRVFLKKIMLRQLFEFRMSMSDGSGESLETIT